ncbi:MAG: hypothetical protein EBR02_03465 [Alphaproteobacteria bacterium]|nr:hypothetical protein [Alphaproteobacteria bacterium]
MPRGPSGRLGRLRRPLRGAVVVRRGPHGGPAADGGGLRRAGPPRVEPAAADHQRRGLGPFRHRDRLGEGIEKAATDFAAEVAAAAGHAA